MAETPLTQDYYARIVSGKTNTGSLYGFGTSPTNPKTTPGNLNPFTGLQLEQGEIKPQDVNPVLTPEFFDPNRFSPGALGVNLGGGLGLKIASFYPLYGAIAGIFGSLKQQKKVRRYILAAQKQVTDDINTVKESGGYLPGPFEGNLLNPTLVPTRVTKEARNKLMEFHRVGEDIKQYGLGIYDGGNYLAAQGIWNTLLNPMREQGFKWRPSLRGTDILPPDWRVNASKFSPWREVGGAGPGFIYGIPYKPQRKISPAPIQRQTKTSLMPSTASFLGQIARGQTERR